MLYKAVNKYGWNSFNLEIFEYCSPDKETLLKREQYYLDTFKPYYNIHITAGSPLGFNHSEETKKILSLARLGEGNPLYGKKGPLAPRWGVKLPDTQILKMKEDFGTKIWLYDIHSKNIINIFVSLHAAAEYFYAAPA